MKYIGFPRPSCTLGNSIQPFKSWTLQATFRASLEAIEMAEDSGFARGQSVGRLDFHSKWGIFATTTIWMSADNWTVLGRYLAADTESATREKHSVKPRV